MAKYKSIVVKCAADLGPYTPIGSLIWVMPDGQGSFDFLGSMYTEDHFCIDEETQKWEDAIEFWLSDKYKQKEWKREWLDMFPEATPKGGELQ
jgi:hypothetical protein